jgi:serine/threonine protein kinase
LPLTNWHAQDRSSLPAVTTPADNKLPFERLGDYDVLAPISEGGMASIWLGRSTVRPEELAALKVIRAEHGRNKEFVAMLVDEAGIATRLEHPNLLRTRSFGHDGKRHFLVMELLRGHSLVDVAKAAHTQGKRLPIDVVAWIGARVADALQYAHDLKDAEGAPLNVVHRDVNPANIFITREGDPKLIDFGLAKARDRIASTAIGVVKGKLAYLAPEQALGQVADHRSDVFALGVTLWELSLDRRLFLEENDVETVRRVRAADVPNPTSIQADYPPALAAALVRALAKDPKDRWQTAAELRDALDAYLAKTGGTSAASVRAVLHDLFAGQAPAEWERIADEIGAEQARTRIWNESQDAPPAAPLPPEPAKGVGPLPAPNPPPFARASTGSPGGGPLRGGKSLEEILSSPVALAAACALAGGLVSGLMVRGCSGHDRAMDRRVGRIEEVLGLGDAGAAVAAADDTTGGLDAAVAAAAAAAAGGGDDHSAACAIARVAAYEAWQEALIAAKANAGPAEAACADFRSDKKKQACFYQASAEARSTQAARDNLIAAGNAARDAVHAVKDNAKNPAIARARVASEAAFTACGGSTGGDAGPT